MMSEISKWLNFKGKGWKHRKQDEILRYSVPMLYSKDSGYVDNLKVYYVRSAVSRFTLCHY